MVYSYLNAVDFLPRSTFQSHNMGEGETVMTTARIPVFKSLGTVELGTHQSTSSLPLALKEKKCRVAEIGEAMLKGLVLGPKIIRVNLVVTTAKELSIPEMIPTYQDICEQAIKRGLRLCPAEVAPQLCLQQGYFREGHLYFGMKPIDLALWGPHIFFAEYTNDGLVLDGTRSHPDNVFSRLAPLVFIRV